MKKAKEYLIQNKIILIVISFLNINLFAINENMSEIPVRECGSFQLTAYADCFDFLTGVDKVEVNGADSSYEDLISVNQRRGLVVIGKRTSKILELKKPLTIVAKTIEIYSDIVTNGYALVLQAETIDVVDKNIINGFLQPAESLPAVTKIPRNSWDVTTPPCSVSPRDYMGAYGYDGLPGNSGSNEVSPIVVMAVSILGQLTINASGQKGGKGQTSGPGAPGVNGCGRDTSEEYAVEYDGKVWFDNLSFVHHKEAKVGGRGSYGGLPGKSGDGGMGGVNIPVVISSLRNFDSYEEEIVIISEPGQGGEHGDLGSSGPSGRPGKGGKGDSKWKKLPFNGKTGEKVEAAADGASTPPREKSAEYASESAALIGAMGPVYDGELAQTIQVMMDVEKGNDEGSMINTYKEELMRALGLH